VTYRGQAARDGEYWDVVRPLFIGLSAQSGRIERRCMCRPTTCTSRSVNVVACCRLSRCGSAASRRSQYRQHYCQHHCWQSWGKETAETKKIA